MGSEGGASIEHIYCSELHPKKPMIANTEGLSIPFQPLCGENVLYLGRTAEGIIALSDFRLFLRYPSSIANIPLTLIDTIETRDIFFLCVLCKDSRMYRFVFETNDSCLEWYKRLENLLNAPRRLEDVFAFSFKAWCNDSREEPNNCNSLSQSGDAATYSFDREVERMEFDLKKAWRLCYVNEKFGICSSYPRYHIVPASTTDREIELAANFRSSRRFPSVVWRDSRNGAVIVRCSQPEVGWLGWRSTQDEALLQAIVSACKLDSGSANAQEKSPSEKQDGSDPKELKMLIVDARSYAAAVANRAKGGGCECVEYYGYAEIQFMNLANIHAVRKSFQAVRSLCTSTPDQSNWLSVLDGTKWLQHLSSLLKASAQMVHAIDKEARPVLVHCSDGWDRTPQLVALTQLMLDPYYRTMSGFAVLVEREWIEFGHKFADRCGHGLASSDTNERCPVFLQFLDCVYQIYNQFPCAFQFNTAFLVKLVQHTYSCLFGNFLCNTSAERQDQKVSEQTASVWNLLKSDNLKFRNFSYTPTNQALRPSHHQRHLKFWTAVYLSEQTLAAGLLANDLEQTDQIETSSETSEAESTDIPQTLPPKTRSCEDLTAMGVEVSSPTRRLSDPNISTDARNLLPSKEIDKEDLMQRSQDAGDQVVEEVKLDQDNNVASYSVKQDKEGSTSETEEQTDVKQEDKLDTTETNHETVEPQESIPEKTKDQVENNGLDDGNDPAVVRDHVETSDHNEADKLVKRDNPDDGETHDEADNHVEGDYECKEDIKGCDEVKTDEAYSRISLECKPFEGSTDTLTGDLAQIQSSAKNSESDIHNESVESVDRQIVMSEEDEQKITSLLQSATVSTSTTDISDSSVQLKQALLLQPSLSKSVGSSAHVLNTHVDNILSLHIPGANGVGRTVDLLVRNHLPSLQQNTYAVNGCSKVNSQCGSIESETHTPKSISQTPNSTSPNTPSTNKSAIIWPNIKHSSTLSWQLDNDGLITWLDPGQLRLMQMEAEYIARIEQLQAQLQNTQLLLKSCFNNGSNFTLPEPKDDRLESGSQESGERGSVEGSDASWEPVEENDAHMTLWVPDHAVTHCAGCDSEFWIGRRRHHCRNCGKVFCNECTNYSLPVPQQQLNSPVRVCKICFGTILENRDEATVLHHKSDTSSHAKDLEAAMMDHDDTITVDSCRSAPNISNGDAITH